MNPKPDDARARLRIEGVDLDLVEYPCAPSGLIIWLDREKVVRASAYSGDLETALRNIDVGAAGTAGATEFGVASVDYLILDRLHNKSARGLS
jgi:hypothetical protein